jgi:hypothetical protein
MRIELFGISVELIISEVEVCEPWPRRSITASRTWLPSGRMSEELRKLIVAGFCFWTGGNDASEDFHSEAEASENQFRNHFGNRAAWQSSPGGGSAPPRPNWGLANFNFRNDQPHRNPREFDPQVNDVLYHVSRSGEWDELRCRHVLISEDWEADLLAAIAACRGTGLDGGKGHDNVRVKRREVIDIPAVAWHVPDDGFMLSFAV